VLPIGPIATGPAAGADPELDAVEEWLLAADPGWHRFARAIRRTIDQLLDGRNTGRWDYDQLHKTEKTHLGTLIEINLHREFQFEDGDATDYRIAGVQVDCKYSKDLFLWEIPPEAIGHLCLVIWASDRKSRWAAGLVRISPEILRTSVNRDGKRKLAEAGRARIRWLEQSGQLAENVLLGLPAGQRDAIFGARSARGSQHGQQRVNELFRQIQGRIITRTVLETVAQQDDSMKRARGNGGARTILQPEGILVIGHQDNDPMVARDLGLPVPRKGEFIAARVVPVGLSGQQGQPVAEIAGERWVVAAPDDPPHPAPVIPR
jgi:hypothetical protein